jgi:hypothetical protein
MNFNTSLTIKAAGTTSGATFVTTPVEIDDLTGPARLDVSCGPAIGGTGAVTLGLRVEFAGTNGAAYGNFACVESAGTLPTFNQAGSHFVYDFDMRNADGVIRLYGAQGGGSPVFPLAATLIGTRIQI